jgi:hypothetical protein
MTGTYEMLVQPFFDDFDRVEGADGIIITIFARPVDKSDEESDRDSPILAQLDVSYEELEGPTTEWYVTGFSDVGEHGLAPEDVEAEFGPELGLRVLLALFQAADRDFRGVDLEERPWREPSMQAFPIMQRTSDVMIILRNKLEMEEG